MRPTLFILVICLIFSCVTSIQSGDRTRFKKLNGTWIPVNQEMGGKVFPEAVYKNQKLIIQDTLYTVIAESTDKGVVKFKDDKMDIYGKEGVNAGKHFTAIYKLENDQLTVCYNLLGDVYPVAFETRTKPLLFLSVFKKELSN